MIPSAHIPSSQELGLDESNFDKTFKNFSAKPLAAASLGQVHTALYKGKKVAIKVQRAKLKEVRALLKPGPKADGSARTR
jgi:predicted unusual protein kinase regulating ubiquinone biosynthesis (AarF/ABC1/UbiB family)